MKLNGWDSGDSGVRAPLHSGSASASLEHLVMINTYQDNGGLVTCDEAAVRLAWHLEQPISRLARWIVARQVVTFPWRSETLVPLFQFNESDMSLRPAVSEVISELACVFDDLDLARWFAQPNGWLGNAEPVAVIDGDPGAVLQAARADRYLAKG